MILALVWAFMNTISYEHDSGASWTGTWSWDEQTVLLHHDEYGSVWQVCDLIYVRVSKLGLTNRYRGPYIHIHPLFWENVIHETSITIAFAAKIWIKGCLELVSGLRCDEATCIILRRYFALGVLEPEYILRCCSDRWRIVCHGLVVEHYCCTLW